MRSPGVVVGLLALLHAWAAAAADPPYNPFVGATQAEPPRGSPSPQPMPPTFIAPPLMQAPVLPREPPQLRVPPPRDLTVVVVHERIAILRTQNGRYPVKDGEVMTLDGARYRAGVKDGTVRLVELDSQIVAFEGYVGSGLAPEQRNQSRRGPGSMSLQPPSSSVPQSRTIPAQLPPLPALTPPRP